MAITYDWECKFAIAKREQILKDGSKAIFETELYTGGNCPFVELYPYKENNEDMVSLYNFAADMEHFKRCVKDGLYKNLKSIKINVYYNSKRLDVYKVIDELIKQGTKVEIYYKEPKKTKKT